MSATQNSFLLGSTATTTALMAGLFFAYSCSVNPGLGRLSDTAYLAAMQAINRAILNPVFFAGFLGTALLLPICTYYAQATPLRFWLLLAASIVYIVGVLGVTIAGNVPLNDALDAVDLPSATVSSIAAQRTDFEAPWNRLHTIRTMAAVLALILVIAACLRSTDT